MSSANFFYNKMREGNAILNNNNHQHSATAEQATKNNPAGLRPWMSRIFKISPDELRLEISFTIRGDQFANILLYKLPVLSFSFSFFSCRFLSLNT